MKPFFNDIVRNVLPHVVSNKALEDSPTLARDNVGRHRVCRRRALLYSLPSDPLIVPTKGNEMNVRTGDISILSCLIFAVLATGCATPDTRRVDAWTEIRGLKSPQTRRNGTPGGSRQDADNHTKDKLAMAWMAASMGGKTHEATPMPAEPETTFDQNAARYLDHCPGCLQHYR